MAESLVNLSSRVSVLTLDTTRSREASDMLCARDARKFEPHGRQFYQLHTGQKHSSDEVMRLANGCSVMTAGPPLVRALRDFTIAEQTGMEMWKLRQSLSTSEPCDEELYVGGRVVIWSRGSLLSTGAVQVLRCFTVDSPVAEALWCNFLLPVDREVTARSVLPTPPSEGPGSTGLSAVLQSGVCVVESGSINVFTHDGRDYIAALPFLVKKTWPIRNGLLFERKVVLSKGDLSKTPKKEQSQAKLPTLFSLRHPLDEMAPIICRTGGNTNASKISFVTEVTQDVVYTCEDPPLIVTYDRQLSTHSIWTYRQAKPEEVETACGGVTDLFATSMRDPGAVAGGLTPGHMMTVPGSHSASQLSRLTTFSSHSPSAVESPMRSHASRLNSPSVNNISGLSRLNSPSMSRFAAASRSLSPSLSHYRLNPTPSPHVKASPTGFSFQSPGCSALTPADHTTFADFGGPLAPEICLDHIWTETGTATRDGVLGAASKAFQTVDFSGQQYFCYLVTFRHHLRCIKFEMSNDQSQLIFGSISVLQARDAVPLAGLQMMAVLELNHAVVLYSGTTRINALHIAGLPSASTMMSVERSSPKRYDTPGLHPTTSSRPQSALDARFDDEVQLLLSPVPTEFNESSQLIESSVVDEPSFHQFGFSGGVVTSLRDGVDNRFTVVLADGVCYRVLLGEMTSSSVISSCLAALRQTLPRETAMLVFCRWYSQRNLPGTGNNCQLEWRQFVACLLGLVGYDSVAALRPITAASESQSESVSPSLQSKKPRLSDHGTDADWEHLLRTDHHRHFTAAHEVTLGLNGVASNVQRTSCTKTTGSIDTSATLFNHIATVLYALHLVYEEMRLDIILQSSLAELGTVLFFLARDIGCELYVDHYCRDLPQLFVIGSHISRVSITQDDLLRVQYPSFFSRAPPNINHWICNYLRRQECLPFPCIPSVSIRTERVIAMYVLTFEKDTDATDSVMTRYLRRISAVGRRVSDTGLVTTATTTTRPASVTREAERLIFCLCENDEKFMKSLALGVAIPMQEAIFQCRSNPPTGWGESAYSLIGRNDLAKQCRLERISVGVMPQWSVPMTTERDRDVTPDGARKNGKDEDDGMSNLDEELLGLRFSKDLRIKEVRRLLQSSRPVRIAIVQRPEISDHEFIEEQERYLYSKCTRTMALPTGRGMFTLRTYQPVPTEAIAIPKLCLTGRAPPRNTTVDLTHIETPANMNYWPQFHNGVAAGLKVANMSQLESSWIVFNKGKTETLSNEHAGFLMGQGLNGHLAAMNSLNVHDYLIRGHEMTSVGILLGLAANKCGTMDMTTIKMLSIHVAALLPPTSTELDVPHCVQVAAILGIGLVYQGTAHRHIAEVLLSEIGRPPGPEGENSVDRESYSLAAGLALGLVMLGKGCDAVGLSDMAMPDQLYLYMVGGQKRPLSSAMRERYKSPSCQIKEGECVNVDVTSPGATLALGLMFFNTNNSSIAEWLAVPETQSLLDFVRPDFLLLRTLSRGLIMWNSVTPTEDWVNSNLPEIVAYYAFNRTRHQSEPDCDIDFETMSQAYCNIVTGACMVIGLKYAGSADTEAFTCLYDTIKRVLRLVGKAGLVEQAGKMTVESCLVVITISLAMVMAGTGDLRVLRLCRHLGSRVGGTFHGFVTYGSHMAISMAVGLLFLGGGKYTLSTRPESVAAMLCAFYPKYPMHSNDNRYHLQAFRHLYVLATEKRIVIPRDVDSNQACYVELELLYKNQLSEVIMAPCLLPELHLLEEIRVKGVRYWPVEFKVNSNWETLQNLLKSTSCLYVKQRAGYLPYAVDPKGYHSVLAHSLTAEQTRGKVLKSKDIQSFSSDPRILAFAEQFCTSTNSKEYEFSQLLSQLVYKAVSQEKLEVLATKIALHQSVAQLDVSCRPLDLWQIKLLLLFYERLSDDPSQKRLMSTEFLIGLQSRVEAHLAVWLQDCGTELSRYFSGSEPINVDPRSVCKLSAFLTWYGVPHPKALAQMGITGVPSFPALYTVLRPSGLPVGTILALCEALRIASLVS